MFVKFCGFTRQEDLEIVKEYPVTAVGFIFFKESKRYIEPSRVREISKVIKGTGIKKVGVFVDTSPENIKEIQKIAGLDYLQIYDLTLIPELSKVSPLIIVYRIKDQSDLNKISLYSDNHLILLDSYHPSQYGGTGHAFNWQDLKDFPYIHQTIIAGGIDKNNLPELLNQVNPFGIDLASGIETTPGIKSRQKMDEIVRIIDPNYCMNTKAE